MTEVQPKAAAAEAPDGFVNTWLQGPFAPVDEEVTEYDLKVTGTIPPELEDGRLLRAGPNPVGPQDPVTYNWFTGNGLVHGVRIRDGRDQCAAAGRPDRGDLNRFGQHRIDTRRFAF